MSSIISGYKYDVYISYHHRDQTLEWVKEFAKKLQQELDTTIKSKPTIYFSTEPGDQTSKDDLKSLIFIPVISDTYCNSDKETWQEFLQFKKNASSDPLGLNLTLPVGEVVSRILPIKISKITDNIQTLLEKELEGNLRSLDFIFDGIEGVTRPLRANDDEMIFRQGSLLYRNQINRASVAIAELLTAARDKLSEGKKPTADENGKAYRDKNTVFLSWSAQDCKSRRDELSMILQKAGMKVLPVTDCPTDDKVFRSRVTDGLKNANCSIHVLGAALGRTLSDSGDPLSLFQISEAKKKIVSDSNNFKVFVWNIPAYHTGNVDVKQSELISEIRNNIVNNMIFTNVPSPVQLVDDIRSMITIRKEAEESGKFVDVCFMCNQLDEGPGKEIADMISDVMPVDPLTIGQDAEVNYSKESVLHIKRSCLAVIFFNEASDWAISFVQQVWKMIGGAASPTPILFIGDSEIELNATIAFNVPKVTTKIVSKDLIPLEIKVMYDKIIEEQT